MDSENSESEYDSFSDEELILRVDEDLSTD